ncbi:MAG: MoaD/ThiS family protein [Bacteroidota bacterium]
MHIKLKAFGIAREIMGGGEVFFSWDGEKNVEGLQKALLAQFPRFQTVKSIKIAINEAYARPGQSIELQDDVAIIPPVSGG